MIIESRNLCFSYGKNQVLKGVSFTALEGEITFLAGENGSGKTTWISNAVSLLRPSSGEVNYDGRPFEQIRPAVSVAFDTTPLYPYLSVVENLKVLFDVDALQTDKHRFLCDMGMDDELIRKKAGKLSYGQKHRVGIAGALLRDQQCYILDEPDLGLDPAAWKTVKNRIIQLRKDGKTIVVTGQNYPMLQEFVSRIVVLKDGIIIYEGTINEFLDAHGESSRQLRQAFERLTGIVGGDSDEK